MPQKGFIPIPIILGILTIVLTGTVIYFKQTKLESLDLLNKNQQEFTFSPAPTSTYGNSTSTQQLSAFQILLNRFKKSQSTSIPTPTLLPTASPIPTPTPSILPTSTPISTPTPTPTSSPTPTSTSTATPTPTPTFSPTPIPALSCSGVSVEGATFVQTYQGQNGTYYLYNISSGATAKVIAQVQPPNGYVNWKMATFSKNLPNGGSFSYPDSANTSMVNWTAPNNPVSTEEGVDIRGDISEDPWKYCSTITFAVQPI